LTSQPPAQDFARVYSLLTSHGYGVISIGLSAQLSGTTSAARQAASRSDSGDVLVIDSLSATAGQGLLAMAAAEAALKGWSAKKVEALVRELIPRTRVFAVADDLSYAVKGGRLPAWVKRIADFLYLNPVLTASPEGKLGLSGFHLGRGANPLKLAQTAAGKMNPETMYRVLVAHANNEAGAVQARQHMLELHPRVHSCHITAAGPALGVHFGPGCLIVGFTPRLGLPG
jgi:DegV family protein with EDD domain